MCKKETGEVEEWIQEFMNMPKKEWEKFVEEIEEAINSEKYSQNTRTNNKREHKTEKQLL